eukprot:145852_1
MSYNFLPTNLLRLFTYSSTNKPSSPPISPPISNINEESKQPERQHVTNNNSVSFTFANVSEEKKENDIKQFENEENISYMDNIDVIKNVIININQEIDVFNENKSRLYQDKSEIFLQNKMNFEKIRKFMKEKHYHKYITIIQREMFIAEITDICQDLSIETANLFYYHLTDKQNDYIHSHFEDELDQKVEDIDFIWHKKANDISLLDRYHFLYMCSIIINQWNEKLKSLPKDKNKPLLDYQSILQYLKNIQMNGFLFNALAHNVFKHSIKSKMIPKTIVST